MNLNRNIVLRAWQSMAYYMTPADKRTSAWMFLLVLVASLLDVFGLASLVPVIMAASRPGSVFHNKYSLWLYQSLHFSSERNFLVFLILGVLVFFLVKNVFTTLINYQQVRFTARLVLRIIERQFQKHNNLPFWEFNQVGSSHLMHSTVNVPQAYLFGIIRPLFIFFSELAIVAIVVLGILFYQPVLFGILVLVLVPATLLIYRGLRNRSQHIGARANALRPVAMSILSDAFVGFIEIKLANKQDQFKQRLLENQVEAQNLEATSYLYTMMPVKIIEMIAILAVVTIFLYSLLFTQNPGGLVVIIGLFAAAAYRLMPSVNRLITSLVSLKQHIFTVENLEHMRQYLEAQAPPTQQAHVLPFRQSITFDRVTFAFPGADEPVLRDVSLQVRKGEKIGLVGNSGSGKTTLMNILLRFYQEQQGQVLIDGQPLTNHNLQAWYRLVGYVKQETFLMETSIQNNITLNDEHLDSDRLAYAVDKASLREFVDSLPEGLNTRIGERGSRLSGGQRQRIGIARALYKKTEVLVLDEATSALDNETEREVSEAIRNLSHTDITIFIIAHRITTLRDCDRIFELRNGSIHAEHKYENLLHHAL